MESIKDDAAAVKAFGIEFGTQMCKALMATGYVQVLHFYTLNLEKVVYGVMDGLGLSQSKLLDQVQEGDAASQVAKGSAWAREGDKVSCIYGEGVVLEMRSDGAAAIQIDSWVMAAGQKPIVYLQKGSYKKVFA